MQIDPRVRKRHGLDGSDGRQACVRGPGQQPVPECKQVSKGHEDQKKGNTNPDLSLNRAYARRAVLDETIERLEREKARLTYTRSGGRLAVRGSSQPTVDGLSCAALGVGTGRRRR